MACPFRIRTQRSFSKWIQQFFSIKTKPNLSEENLKAILDTTVDAIITIDPKGNILSFNKAAERIFGYTKEEILGKNVHILMPEPFDSKHDAYIQHYLSSGVKKIIGIGREVSAKCKDGSILPIDLAVSEVIIGKNRFFTGIIRDISSKKECEILHAKNLRIEAELKLQHEFLSILKHELRTPLTAIEGALGILSQEKSLPKKMEELVTIALRNTKDLSALVRNVLDAQMLHNSGVKMDLRSVVLEPIIQEAINHMRSFAEECSVSIIYNPDPIACYVYADRDRLLQVLLNLLSNAIKFSPKRGKVTVSSKQKDGTVRVSIRDEGEGFSQEFSATIFSPFAQESKRDDRLKGGLGLGLSICKKIMEALHGHIGFVKETPKGTTFYFELSTIEPPFKT